MKLPEFDSNWPIIWKNSYRFDTMEIGFNDNDLGYTYAYRNRFNNIIELLKIHTPLSSTILDVAAAQGNFTLSLAEDGYNMIWNDLRTELIDYVKLKYTKGQIIFQPGNLFDLTFSIRIDAIIITEIIEHVAHPDLFLKKVSSCLIPGGKIYMTTPLGSYFLNKLPKFSECENPSIYESTQFQPDSDGHIFLLHINEIEQLANLAGLKVLSMKTYNNSLTSGHIKLHYILPIIPFFVINFLEKLSYKLPLFIRKKIHSNIAFVFEKI